MKKDLCSCEHNLCDCLRSLKKIQDFNGIWTCDLAIPVWCSNLLNYEATDVGSWSFMCLLLMIYEINHIFFYVFIFRRNWGPKDQNFFFLRLGPPCLRDWMTSTPSALPPPPSPLPPPTPFSLKVWIGHWELACRLTFEGLVT